VNSPVKTYDKNFYTLPANYRL